MAKPPIEYRQPSPASSAGAKTFMGYDDLSVSEPVEVTLLKHKRAVKAAAQRRYRLAVKSRKGGK